MRLRADLTLQNSFEARNKRSKIEELHCSWEMNRHTPNVVFAFVSPNHARILILRDYGPSYCILAPCFIFLLPIIIIIHQVHPSEITSVVKLISSKIRVTSR